MSDTNGRRVLYLGAPQRVGYQRVLLVRRHGRNVGLQVLLPTDLGYRSLHTSEA